MPRIDLSPETTIAAIFAGCALANTAHTHALTKFKERRYERRASEIRSIVTDRLHMDPSLLKKKYGDTVTPIK